jgi:hypothetical protein
MIVNLIFALTPSEGPPFSTPFGRSSPSKYSSVKPNGAALEVCDALSKNEGPFREFPSRTHSQLVDFGL